MTENPHHDQSTQPVLVLGGTGKTGRRVAQRLAASGVPTRIGSRAGEPPFEWHDRATWAPVLQGTRAAYIVYYPDLAMPGAAEAVGDFAEEALANGVDRLVLLSGRGEEGAQEAERAVQESGAAWTVLRAAFFDQDFSEHFLLGPVLEGIVALPAGDVAEPFVDVEDIADIAAAALTDDRHVGQLYELTGPRLLTFTDAVAEISEATGRDIRYLPVSGEEYADAAAGAGVPPDEVDLLVALFAEIFDGRNQYVADGVERALGRPARDFADYARAAAATGVWTP